MSEIELEYELISCNGCGVVLDRDRILTRTEQRSPNDAKGVWECLYTGTCPVCKHSFQVWE